MILMMRAEKESRRNQRLDFLRSLIKP